MRSALTVRNWKGCEVQRVQYRCTQASITREHRMLSEVPTFDHDVHGVLDTTGLANMNCA